MNLFYDLTPPVRSSTRRGEAFTLIELLVVISIIAILAGLLLPVVSKVAENARKTAAKSAVTQIVTAVNNYQTDYGQYPVPVATTTDYTYGANTATNNYLLFDVLRALNASDGAATSALNSRRVVYFEGKTVKNPNVPRDGFVVSATGTGSSSTPLKSANGSVTKLSAGDLLDPWGNEYYVRMDSGYSNMVDNPLATGKTGATADDTADTATASSSNPALLNLGVVAGSYGLDGKIGNNGTVDSTYTSIGDDVVSWQ